MLAVTVAPTSTALTTSAAAQRELQLGQSDLDSIAEVIEAASRACAAWCSRDHDTGHEFAAQTVRQTERLLRPVQHIRLDRDLNPAVSSITEDGVALTASDWELDGTILYRLSADARTWWPTCTLVITYTTGYSLPASVPRDLERACLHVMAGWMSARGRDPLVRSESVDAVVSMSYLDPRAGMEGIPPQAAGLLTPWRKDL